MKEVEGVRFLGQDVSSNGVLVGLDWVGFIDFGKGGLLCKEN